jgi:mRNA-degrading endonuclease RelE of RelBE toxin-antitoxin system
MDKIQKALNRLTEKEKEAIKSLLLQLKAGDLGNFDLKKLKGRDDIFRVRKGKMRIIFFMKNQEIRLLAIERRNNNTYHD